jgi:lipoprotein-releasing system ATP-binding protein
VADLLIAEGLVKVYSEVAPTTALRGVGFRVGCGEFASIIGRSGSGKSTLLNLIGLLDMPTEGRLVLNDVDTSTLDRDGRARLRNEFIGFVFQFHHLLPEFSVVENVYMPALIRGDSTPVAQLRARAIETLEGLGLDGVADKNANEISGGQKQRVAIARALMNRPQLILADEPTGNLDTQNTELVYELFRKVNREQGTGFLIVTHDRGIAQQTDRILEISDGSLLQDVRVQPGEDFRELAEEALVADEAAAHEDEPAGEPR